MAVQIRPEVLDCSYHPQSFQFSYPVVPFVRLEGSACVGYRAYGTILLLLGQYRSQSSSGRISLQPKRLGEIWKSQQGSTGEEFLQLREGFLALLGPQKRHIFLSQCMKRSSHLGKVWHKLSIIRGESQKWSLHQVVSETAPLPSLSSDLSGRYHVSKVLHFFQSKSAFLGF